MTGPYAGKLPDSLPRKYAVGELCYKIMNSMWHHCDPEDKQPTPPPILSVMKWQGYKMTVTYHIPLLAI